MKKLLPFIIILLIIVSCGSGTVDNNSGKQQETNETVSTELDYYKNVPNDLNYDGYNFIIFTYDVANWDTYVDKDEINGEILNDAAYMRNAEVVDMLNIEISSLKRPDSGMINDVLKNNAAGDAPYDLILFWSGTNVTSLITENQIYDWNKIPYLGLNEKWYNQSANDVFTVNGKQYFGVSDISYTVQQHFRFMFNKDLCTDLGLDYPYQLVYDGKWTFDALSRYVKDSYADLNGDGKRDKDDRYGFTIGANQAAYFILNWGEFPLGVNDNGFVLNIYSDRIATMVEKAAVLINTPDVAIYPDIAPQYSVFNAGRGLFQIYSSDPALLREIEVDFGFLPYPKYDERQNDYITATHGGIMAVPIIKTEAEVRCAGAIIEALSAASSKYIVDAFVSMYIEGKVLRDDDSVNMYRLARRTASYDRARIFDSTGLVSVYYPYYTDPIYKSGTINLASQYEKNRVLIETAFEEMYQSILANQ